LVVARCQVDYAGRLTAHLPMAMRVLMIKADGSVLVHSDGGSYKPLNWMSPPCSVKEGTSEDGAVEWTVTGKDGDTLRILLEEIQHDSSHELGVDPGLQKDGVEKHLQELLAEHPAGQGRPAVLRRGRAAPQRAAQEVRRGRRRHLCRCLPDERRT
jgi:RecB family endonuclease NucS